jgi:hypothetical protein
MKIKRGSIITNLSEIKELNTVIPTGTLGTVYKVKRSGSCPCLVVFKGFHHQHWLDFCNIKLADTSKSMPAIGDLFYSSWGYEQTNIDFYQVVGISKSYIEVVRIKDDRKYSDQGMCGETIPLRGQFHGEKQKHRLRFDTEGRPNFKLTSYSSAWPCDDSPKFFSEWR